jgi:hypothetical protein
VTEAMKKQVFESYGVNCLDASGNPITEITPTKSLPRCRDFEIDHLVSRELGGADDVKNLWPESYSGQWNAHQKDRLENRLHKEVCAGHMSLQAAQSGIAADWTRLYVKYFGQPPGAVNASR